MGPRIAFHATHAASKQDLQRTCWQHPLFQQKGWGMPPCGLWRWLGVDTGFPRPYPGFCRVGGAAHASCGPLTRCLHRAIFAAFPPTPDALTDTTLTERPCSRMRIILQVFFTCMAQDETDASRSGRKYCVVCACGYNPATAGHNSLPCWARKSVAVGMPRPSQLVVRSQKTLPALPAKAGTGWFCRW